MIIKVTAGNDVEVSVYEFPNGSIRDINKRLTDLLGCDWYERIRPRRVRDNWGIHNISMLVDEEGLLKPNKLNYLGTWLYGAPIMGNILFVTEKVTDDGPEFCGLEEEQARDLILEITDFLKNEKAIKFNLRDQNV